MKAHRLLMLLLTIACALFVVSCGDDEDDGGGGGGSNTGAATTGGGAEVEKFDAATTMGKIQEKGEIVIGVKYDVPPFGFKNPRNSEIEGFDIDFGKAVADALGVKPKLVEAISDNRIPFIKDGTVDLILSTMTINAERVEQIDFTDPYFIARGRILQKKGGLGQERRRPRRQERLHRARLDLRGDAQEAGARGQAQARRHVLGVPRAHPERRRRRGLDRRRDPHRHDHPGRRARARRGRGAHGRALRRRPQEGRRRVHRVPQRRARRTTSPTVAGRPPTTSGWASTPARSRSRRRRPSTRRSRERSSSASP